MYPAGYMSLSWVTQGFLRASTGHGKRVCPLSIPVFEKRALGKCVAHEKSFGFSGGDTAGVHGNDDMVR